MSEAVVCGYGDCVEEAYDQCENCDAWFCEAHGTPGRDREGDEGRLTEAYPSVCWKCGGFNADTD